MYYKFMGTQFFKIIDEKTVLNIRNDNKITGYGVGPNMTEREMEEIKDFTPSNEEEFKAALQDVLKKLTEYNV